MSMTPDEVVARARTMEGREVLLTVRGVVRNRRGDWWLENWAGLDRMIAVKDATDPVDLVDIQPAPMRIVAGQLYADEGGELYRGLESGAVARIGDFLGGLFGIPTEKLVGLRAVKVVDQ